MHYLAFSCRKEDVRCKNAQQVHSCILSPHSCLFFLESIIPDPMKQTDIPVILHEKDGLCRGGLMKSCCDINNVAQPSPVCGRVMGILNDMKRKRLERSMLSHVCSHIDCGCGSVVEDDAPPPCSNAARVQSDLISWRSERSALSPHVYFINPYPTPYAHTHRHYCSSLKPVGAPLMNSSAALHSPLTYQLKVSN